MRKDMKRCEFDECEEEVKERRRIRDCGLSVALLRKAQCREPIECKPW